MRLIDLTYTLIPNLISSVNNGRLSRNYLWNFNYWKEIAEESNWDEEGCDFDWNELTYSIYSYLDGYYSLILYKFPEVPLWPYSKYGAIIFDNEKSEVFNYYTAEVAERDTDNSHKWTFNIITLDNGELRREEWGEINNESTVRNFIKEISEINSFTSPKLIFPKSKSACVWSIIWSIARFLIVAILSGLYFYWKNKW